MFSSALPRSRVTSLNMQISRRSKFSSDDRIYVHAWFGFSDASSSKEFPLMPVGKQLSLLLTDGALEQRKIET